MPVRIAVVGADETTRAVLETFQTLEDARVVAVCAGAKNAIEYSKAETLARRVKGRAFRDVKTLLRDDKTLSRDDKTLLRDDKTLSRDEAPDALCVVASGRARRDAELLGMQNGLDIFLMSPFATSPQSAQTLLKNAQQSRSRLWISHHERFFASCEPARKSLASRGNEPFACFGSWRMETRSAQGAAVLASSTRLIGLLRFLCGDIQSVFARSSPTCTTLNLEFSNGANGAFVIGAGSENILHFQSQNQHLEWREKALTIRRGQETQRIEYSNDGKSHDAKTHDARREELRLWIQSVQSGRRTLQKSSPQDSLQTLRVALAIQQSAKTNKPVRIN